MSPLPSASATSAPLREEVDALFEILARSGAGGMGTVYEALERRSGRKVALKTVSSGPGAYARFALEAEVLSRLDHPGIVSYVAYGETTDGPWLAMEWLEGETLSDALLRGPFDVRSTLTLGVELADALAAAHASNIVHRDLKPSNIFLVGGDRLSVKVLDFGVARLREDNRELTLTNQIVGTPGYMAPEQARGLRNIDARADLFSLGCVLFLTLTGAAPFDGPDVISVLAKLATQDPPPVGELVDDVPEPLERLLISLLAKAPADRPSSASEVRDELVRISTLLVEGPPIRRPRRGDRGAGLLECVVLARRVTDAHSDTAEGATEALTVGGRTFDDLRAQIESAGGRLRALGSGALLVEVDRMTSSVDRARAAARCAGILSDAEWQVSIAAGSSERVSARDDGAFDTTLAAGASGVNVAIDRASITLSGVKAGSVRVAPAKGSTEEAFYRELLRAVRDVGAPLESAPTELAVASTRAAKPDGPRSLRSSERRRITYVALAFGGAVLGALAIGGFWWSTHDRQSNADASPRSSVAVAPLAPGPLPEPHSNAARPAVEPSVQSATPSSEPSARAAPALSARAPRNDLKVAPAPSISSPVTQPPVGPARDQW